jgi:hypothetical protein
MRRVTMRGTAMIAFADNGIPADYAVKLTRAVKSASSAGRLRGRVAGRSPPESAIRNLQSLGGHGPPHGVGPDD